MSPSSSAGQQEEYDGEALWSSFPLLNGALASPPVYLDNAATTLKPQPVLNAIHGYYAEYSANVHRGTYPMSIRASEEYEMARQQVAHFVDADDDYVVVFTAGCTDAINMIALAYQLESELSVTKMAFATSEYEHHSSYVPWQQTAKRLGKEFRVIPLADDGALDMDRAEQCIKDAAVLSITGMSNVTGYVPPLKQLLQLCQKHGTRLLLDAAQLAGHAAISLQELPIDALCFSAHKLCGPTGIGALCIRREWMSQLPIVKSGGGSISRVMESETHFLEAPEGYEPGTPNIAGAIGFAAALRFLQSIGMQQIAERDCILRKAMLEQFAELEGFRFLGQHPSIESAIVSLVSTKLHSQDLAFFLEMKNIAVRIGHLCAQPLLAHFGTSSVLRVSAYFYNKVEEIELLGQCLREIQSMEMNR